METVSQNASNYSACSSHSTFEESFHLLEERITLVANEMTEKERLLISLKEEKDKLKEQYIPLLGDEVFQEYIFVCTCAFTSSKI